MGHYDKQREEQAEKLRLLDRKISIECPIQKIKNDILKIIEENENIKKEIAELKRIVYENK